MRQVVKSVLAAQRDALRAAHRRLAEAQEALRQRRPDVAPTHEIWLNHSRGLETQLAAKASVSLFDHARLAAAAKLRLPG